MFPSTKYRWYQIIKLSPQIFRYCKSICTIIEFLICDIWYLYRKIKNPLTFVSYKKSSIPHCTLAVQGLLIHFSKWLLSLTFWPRLCFSPPIGSSVVMWPESFKPSVAIGRSAAPDCTAISGSGPVLVPASNCSVVAGYTTLLLVWEECVRCPLLLA